MLQTDGRGVLFKHIMFPDKLQTQEECPVISPLEALIQLLLMECVVGYLVRKRPLSYYAAVSKVRGIVGRVLLSFMGGISDPDIGATETVEKLTNSTVLNGPRPNTRTKVYIAVNSDDEDDEDPRLASLQEWSRFAPIHSSSSHSSSPIPFITVANNEHSVRSPTPTLSVNVDNNEDSARSTPWSLQRGRGILAPHFQNTDNVWLCAHRGGRGSGRTTSASEPHVGVDDSHAMAAVTSALHTLSPPPLSTIRSQPYPAHSPRLRLPDPHHSDSDTNDTLPDIDL